MAVRGCAWLCVAVRGCARQLDVRVVQMWYQVEVWLDGGVLGRTSPFRRTSLVPQMRRYHVKLKEVARINIESSLAILLA